MEKKQIVIEVEAEIAAEIQEGIKGFIDDFYSADLEAGRISVGDVTDKPAEA